MNIYRLNSTTDSDICYALVVSDNEDNARLIYPDQQISHEGIQYLSGCNIWNGFEWSFKPDEDQLSVDDDKWCNPDEVTVTLIESNVSGYRINTALDHIETRCITDNKLRVLEDREWKEIKYDPTVHKITLEVLPTEYLDETESYFVIRVSAESAISWKCYHPYNEKYPVIKTAAEAYLNRYLT